jgi:hypothetical protein
MIAILGLVFAFPDFDKHFPNAHIPWVGFVVAVVALLVAGVLNIVQVGDWAKTHSELFLAWSELRKDAIMEDHKTCDSGPKPDHIERLSEMKAKEELLNSQESFAPRKHILRFQREENMRYGIAERENATKSPSNG